MNITLDTVRCQGLGLCAFSAPDLFELNDEGTVDFAADVPVHLEPSAIEAARNCPTAAITTQRS